MKLAAKLMLVFLVAMMLMTGVASYTTVQRAYERFERRERESALRATQEIDEQLVEAWRQGGITGLVRAIQRLTPHDGQLRVRWVWYDGIELLPGYNGMSAVSNEVVSYMSRDNTGRRHLYIYCPVMMDNGQRGALQFSRPLASLEEETRDTIAVALTSIGIMAVMAFGMVYFAGLYWIARPLEMLIAKTRRAGNGDFSSPVSLPGRDEMSELARALNDMCDQLSGQQARIHAETAQRLTAMEQLRHADRLKTVGRLAAGIAHEMGTPLNVVSGRAALIASGKLSPEESKSSAQAIKNEADRITAIIRQLLDFARQRTRRCTDTDLAELLQRTMELVRPIAEKHQVELRLEVAPDVPHARADSSQLQQVFTNILVNAIQSMPRGGTVSLAVCEQRRRRPEAADAEERNYVTIAVTDQGEGIAPENLEHVFEPFFTTKDVGEGTGLGLSIAYGIVQDHDGWIEVSSELGKGSCFRVYLPQESEQCAAKS